MTIDEKIMRRCFQLAKLGLGKVTPNPMVGAVIYYKNKIIGEGFHQIYGGAHAEVNAFASVKEKDKRYLKDSSLYVSLEPCFHYGKTPPCVDLVLRHHIKKVIISCVDPTKKVGGKSIQKLKANGIDVKVGILEEEGLNLIQRFATYELKKRPYIILKYAQSSDGFIGKNNEQVWITNSISKRLVHKWRSEEGAILVGTNTALIDNPRLNNRLYFGKHPLRITIDLKKKLGEHYHLLDDSLPTLIFTSNKNRSIAFQQTTFVDIKNRKELLPKLIEVLNHKKINSLIVEGGSTLINHFIENRIWDEARVFIGKKNFYKGIQAPPLLLNRQCVEIKREDIGDDELIWLKP